MVDMFEKYYERYATIDGYGTNPPVSQEPIGMIAVRPTVVTKMAAEEPKYSNWDEVVADAQARLENQSVTPLPGPRPEIIERALEEPWGTGVQAEARQRTMWVAYTPAK